MKKLLLELYFLLRLPLIMAIRLALPPRKKEGVRVCRILVIRLDRMGDLVISLPLFANLRQAYPDAEITCLVRPYLKDLAGLIKDIDKVMVYEGFMKTARWLRQRHFDMAIDPVWNYTLKTALLSYLSASPVRVGFAWGFRQMFLSDWVNADARKGQHGIEMNLSLLEHIGVATPVRVPTISAGGLKITPADTIGIHPGGHYASQRWSKENFALLVLDLLERTRGDILIVGAGAERLSAEHIVARAHSPRVKAIYPGLGQLPGVLASCAVVVCNNSGPLHLAAALGVPTVSTMGPTDPALWWPRGTNQAVVIRKSPGCAPCAKAICAGHACLENIAVSEVAEAVLDVLQKAQQQEGANKDE